MKLKMTCLSLNMFVMMELCEDPPLDRYLDTRDNTGALGVEKCNFIESQKEFWKKEWKCTKKDQTTG